LLNRIKNAGELACRAACEDKSKLLLRGAVNWANLHCIEATRSENQDGDITWSVLVEQAASDATQLQQYIARKVKESEGVDVEVRTEW